MCANRNGAVSGLLQPIKNIAPGSTVTKSLGRLTRTLAQQRRAKTILATNGLLCNAQQAICMRAKKTLIKATKTIMPALIIIDERGQSIAPLLVSRVLLAILFSHQWLMVNYYAVMELARVGQSIAAALWRDMTRPVAEAVPVLVAGILIKSIWWGVTA